MTKTEGERATNDDGVGAFVLYDVFKTKTDTLGDFLIILSATDRGGANVKASFERFARGNILPFELLTLISIEAMAGLELVGVGLD